MLNKEKFKDEIVELACKGLAVAMKNGVITPCNNTGCHVCQFGQGACRENRKKWAESEYEEYVDWSKVPVYSKIMVKDGRTQIWTPRYFARVASDGTVYTFSHGRTSFTSAYDDVTPWRYAKLYKEGE